jgi:hypothetical protein
MISFLEKGLSFKRFLTKLGDACTTMVDNEKREEP